MIISIQELEVRKVEFEREYGSDALDLAGSRLRIAGRLAVRGRAELIAPLGEIRVRGHLKGWLDAECDRCLDPIRVPVDEDFDLGYLPSAAEPEAEEVAIEESDTNIGFFEGSGIDLKDVVREQLLLDVPMQRLCRPGCQGICPMCGNNRNLAPCHCEIHPPDERWAALGAFAAGRKRTS